MLFLMSSIPSDDAFFVFPRGVPPSTIASLFTSDQCCHASMPSRCCSCLRALIMVGQPERDMDSGVPMYTATYLFMDGVPQRPNVGRAPRRGQGATPWHLTRRPVSPAVCGRPLRYC